MLIRLIKNEIWSEIPYNELRKLRGQRILPYADTNIEL